MNASPENQMILPPFDAWKIGEKRNASVPFNDQGQTRTGRWKLWRKRNDGAGYERGHEIRITAVDEKKLPKKAKPRLTR